MEIPDELISAFPPSEDLLLECVRRRTDDAMLRDIAEADYGQMADEMMTELRPIRDRGVIPAPPSWMLSEVLTLTHYCNPESPNPPPFEPGPTGHRGHQTRLFACAVLLRIEADLPYEYHRSTDSALAQCLASAKVLGEQMGEATASYFTWRLSRESSGPESLLFALGLLILATRLRSGRFSEPTLGEMAGWVLALESLEQGQFAPETLEPRPLPFSIQAGFWRPLAEEFRNEIECLREIDIRTDLELCGLILDPGW
ncbi:hypothetical protein P12x_004884 [Tundrisphaera lichenicola]|uniref:hypothetical protein n=1 Tax=Tundrisphaera lichenicola TaxID=2029860 RepID=UPI003EB9744F